MNSDKDKIYMKVVERKEIHNFLVYDLFIYWYIKNWYNIQIYICRSKYYIDYFSTKMASSKNVMSTMVFCTNKTYDRVPYVKLYICALD